MLQSLRGAAGFVLAALLLGLLLVFNYVLWLDPDQGLPKVRRLEATLAAQRDENRRLEERNAALEAEVRSLKQGLAAIEERARTDLGMIRRGETFYQILEATPDPP